MTKTIEIIGAVAAVAIIVAGVLFVLMEKPQQAYGIGMMVENNIGNTASSSALVTTFGTSTRIAATTTNPVTPDSSNLRVWTSICTTAALPVALNLDGDKPAALATGHVTTFIAAAAGYSACFEINDRNQYNGAITASSTGPSASITVKQYTRPY